MTTAVRMAIAREAGAWFKGWSHAGQERNSSCLRASRAATYWASGATIHANRHWDPFSWNIARDWSKAVGRHYNY